MPAGLRGDACGRTSGSASPGSSFCRRSARAESWPTTWASARRSRRWRSSSRRKEREGPRPDARRVPDVGRDQLGARGGALHARAAGRSSSTARRATQRAIGRRVRPRRHHLRAPAARHRRARGDPLPLRRPRRGAEHQERRQRHDAAPRADSTRRCASRSRARRSRTACASSGRSRRSRTRASSGRSRAFETRFERPDRRRPRRARWPPSSARSSGRSSCAARRTTSLPELPPKTEIDRVVDPHERRQADVRRARAHPARERRARHREARAGRELAQRPHGAHAPAPDGVRSAPRRRGAPGAAPASRARSATRSSISCASSSPRAAGRSSSRSSSSSSRCGGATSTHEEIALRVPRRSDDEARRGRRALPERARRRSSSSRSRPAARA